MAEAEEDINSKFQRLLQQYVKVKKQNSILKQAVVTEQNTNKQLTSELKEREVAHRTTLEHNEILSFNNQRLTKRLSSLQDEMTARRNEGSGWFSSGTKSELIKKKQELDVVRQELSIKIDENERLHIRMFEQNQSNKEQLEKLDAQLRAVSVQLRQQQEETEKAAVQHKEEIEKYIADNTLKTAQAERFEIALHQTTQAMEQRAAEFSQLRAKLEDEIDSARKCIQTHISFNDAAIAEYNSLNVPSCGRQLQKNSKHIVAAGMEIITGFFGILNEFYTAKQKRENAIVRSGSVDNERDLKAVHREIARNYSEFHNVINNLHQHIQSLEHEFLSLRSFSISVSTGFVSCLKVFVLQNEKQLGLQQLCQQYLKIQVPQHLQLLKDYRTLQVALEKLLLSFSLSFPSECVTCHSANSLTIFQQLMEAVKSVKFAFKNLTSTHERVAEFEAHTVKDEHKQANEQICKTSKQLTHCMDKLHHTLEELFTTVLQQPTARYVRGVDMHNTPSSSSSSVSCEVQPLEARARRYQQKLNALPEWISVPYQTAVKNITFITEVEHKKAAYEAAISDGVARLQEEEKEKERVIKELTATKDLLASKKDQMTSLLTELSKTRQSHKELMELYNQKQAGGGGTGEPGNLNLNMNLEDSIQMSETKNSTTTTSSTITPSNTVSPQRGVSRDLKFTTDSTTTTTDGRHYQMTVIDEDGNENNSLNVTKLDREREAAMKQHFKAKRAQILSQMKMADEKAVKYHQEYERVCNELVNVIESSKDISNRLQESLENQRIAKEDLESTRRNYEDQMKLMTEHFMTLTDKVSKQDNTIQKLEGSKVHCARCGTWNTVAWLTSAEGLNGRRCSRGAHPSSYNFS